MPAHGSAEAPGAGKELEHDRKVQGPANGDAEPRRTLFTSFAHRTTWARSFSGSLLSCSASRPSFFRSGGETGLLATFL